ncbi:hypothetical protein ABK040_011217 [Willaertia magna]
MSSFENLIQQITSNQEDEIIYLDRNKLVEMEEECNKNGSNLINNNNTIIVNVRGKKLNNSQDLFNVFNKELQFLDYFGNNWDALLDVLRDYPGQAKNNRQQINTIIINNINLMESKLATYFKVIKIAKQESNGCRILIVAATADKNEIVKNFVMK